MTVPNQPHDDPKPRWEKAAEERRQNGGLGLPANFTVPRWLPPVLFVFLFINSVKQAFQADGGLDLGWAVVGILLWGYLLVILARRNSRKE